MSEDGGVLDLEPQLSHQFCGRSQAIALKCMGLGVLIAKWGGPIYHAGLLGISSFPGPQVRRETPEQPSFRGKDQDVDISAPKSGEMMINMLFAYEDHFMLNPIAGRHCYSILLSLFYCLLLFHFTDQILRIKRVKGDLSKVTAGRYEN